MGILELQALDIYLGSLQDLKEALNIPPWDSNNLYQYDVRNLSTKIF